MPKLLITIPDDMQEALQEIATRSNKPMAAIVRESLAKSLKSEGYALSHHVRWGGERKVSSGEPR